MNLGLERKCLGDLDVFNENPSFSIREAREKLMEENEHRNDLLQKYRIARNGIGRGVVNSYAKAPKKSQSRGHIGSKRIESDRHRLPSPNRSISFPIVTNLHPAQVPLKGLKSNSVPPSLYASPQSRRSGSISSRKQHNDRLVHELKNRLLRSITDPKR